MSVTADTSHKPIGPFGPAEQSPTDDSFMHSSTAALSAFLFWGVDAAVTVTAVKVLGGEVESECESICEGGGIFGLGFGIGVLRVVWFRRGWVYSTRLSVTVTYHCKKSVCKGQGTKVKIKSYSQSVYCAHTFLQGRIRIINDKYFLMIIINQYLFQNEIYMID